MTGFAESSKQRQAMTKRVYRDRFIASMSAVLSVLQQRTGKGELDCRPVRQANSL